MDLDKKAEEILNDKLNEHKHRMADALFGSTEEMVLDAIKQALTLTVVGVSETELVCLYCKDKVDKEDIVIQCDECYGVNHP